MRHNRMFSEERLDEPRLSIDAATGTWLKEVNIYIWMTAKRVYMYNGGCIIPVDPYVYVLFVYH